MSSATEFNSVDSFLEHEGSGARRGKYLKSWTKNGSIRLWLHTRRMPLAVWQHQFPTLVVFDDKDTRESTTVFWNRPHTCWESEAFLKEQYKRDDDSGMLEVGTPKKCSLCRMIDCVYRAIFAGKIDWTAPLFRFDNATSPKDDVTLHAGGVCNMFNSNRITEKQVAHLKSKGIRQSEAWKESCYAKLQYVLCMVNDDEPRDGVQIATQTSLVGEAIKKVIRDTQASLGKEEGNPMLHPFCIELTYDDRAPINKRYHGRRIERIKLTADVDRMIREEPPSLAGVTRPFDQRALRPFLEKHAVIQLPWDEIFDVPVLSVSAEESAEVEDGDDRTHDPRVAARAESRSLAKDVGVVPCDRCKAPMREDEDTCNGCGAKYDIDLPDPQLLAVTPGRVSGARIPF